MRKLLQLGLVALSVAVFCPAARADVTTDGALTFTISFGSPTPTASFVYDDTTNTWTSFTFDWDGVVFDLGSDLNGSSTSLTGFEAIPASWCAEAPDEPNGTLCTEMGSLNIGSEIEIGPETPANYTDPTAAAFGGYTVTTFEVPEPPMALGLPVLVAVFITARHLTRSAKRNSTAA